MDRSSRTCLQTEPADQALGPEPFGTERASARARGGRGAAGPGRFRWVGWGSASEWGWAPASWLPTTVMVFPCSTIVLTGSLCSVTLPASTSEFSTSLTAMAQPEVLERGFRLRLWQATELGHDHLARGNHKFHRGPDGDSLARSRPVVITSPAGTVALLARWSRCAGDAESAQDITGSGFRAARMSAGIFTALGPWRCSRMILQSGSIDFPPPGRADGHVLGDGVAGVQHVDWAPAWRVESWMPRIRDMLATRERRSWPPEGAAGS